jgi:hypothetical protein
VQGLGSCKCRRLFQVCSLWSCGCCSCSTKQKVHPDYFNVAHLCCVLKYKCIFQAVTSTLLQMNFSVGQFNTVTNEFFNWSTQHYYKWIFLSVNTTLLQMNFLVIFTTPLQTNFPGSQCNTNKNEFFSHLTQDIQAQNVYRNWKSNIVYQDLSN